MPQQLVDSNEMEIWSVTDLVASINQTLDFAYGRLIVEGEILNLRISRNTWVYFDIKDEMSSLRCFGSVYSMAAPLENGMKIRVEANPKLHPVYGFSLNVQAIMPVGEGSIKRATDLLKSKLEKEGIFDEERKRFLPSVPRTIGLVTSYESAAFQDFIKIATARWPAIKIELYDCLVQGSEAPGQIVRAIEFFNSRDLDVVVVIRGGGSSDDLSAFSTEPVVRAVSNSRNPTMVAVGHENDICLAELASDKRASTPSNAAELLLPNWKTYFAGLGGQLNNSLNQIENLIENNRQQIKHFNQSLSQALEAYMASKRRLLKNKSDIVISLDPELALKRGYAIVKSGGKFITSKNQIKSGQEIQIGLKDGQFEAIAK